jgi:phage gpG-like protein
MLTAPNPMLGVAVDFQAVMDDARVQRLLSEMIREGRDLTPAMKQIAAVTYGDEKDIFRIEGKPAKWAPLSPMTLALRRKGKRAGTPKILRDTGRGFASVTSAQGEGAIYRPRPDSLVMGTSVPYMAKHMKGEGPRTATLDIREHTVRRHSRTITQAFGKPIAPQTLTVNRHTVRAHRATFHFGRLPRRVFIQWSDVVIEKALQILGDQLLKPARA